MLNSENLIDNHLLPVNEFHYLKQAYLKEIPDYLNELLLQEIIK